MMDVLRDPLPFTGRAIELDALARLRADAAAGRGSVVLLSGDGGIGKTRLLQEHARTALEHGWQVAIGRAYPLETASPYAPFSDALAPVLSSLEPGTLTRLTRGDRAILATLAPELSGTTLAAAMPDGLASAEERLRLHAGILQLLRKLGERAPLLLAIENLQWADSSSIELLHFLGRQLQTHRVLLAASWNESEQPISDELRVALRSLRALSVATDLRLAALSRDDLRAMLTAYFGVEPGAVDGFASALHHFTQGNSFFVEQTLRELVTRGDLRLQSGVWTGWHIERLQLPHSVRDVLGARIDRLSAEARDVAEVIAVIGTETGHDIVRHVCGIADDALIAATRELREAAIIVERADRRTVSYDVAHPMLQQALLTRVGKVRERDLHARTALAIEQAAGAQAHQHTDAIAAHWQRAHPQEHTATAVQWLLSAGRQALARHARREAADTLHAALDRADAHPESVAADVVPALLDELSRLYRRLGDYQQALTICERARDLASTAQNIGAIAAAERRIGLSLLGLSRREEALTHFDNAIASASAVGDETLVTRIRLAKSDCLQALGLADVAKLEVASALESAERLAQLPLMARAHRALLMLYLWTGPAHRAWAHARSAVELAERSGERNLAWSAHWAAAVLGGLTSNASALSVHLAEATRLAQELHSPLLELRTMEIALEFRAGTGDWDRALVDGERALAVARSLEQTTLLARLLHWVGGVYLYRGDIETARALMQEAWDVSGAESADTGRPFEVHGVLPAYVARTMYNHAIGDRVEALSLGKIATAMADRTGYIAWAVYRLFPTMADAAIETDDRETLAEVRGRLEHSAEVLAHPIGNAWVAVIDGATAIREGRFDDGIANYHRAIALLESVPHPYDAARTRLRLARALQQAGSAQDATHEARFALSMFEKLGARPAAEATRALLRTLGFRVASAARADLTLELTTREREIVVLVAQRLTNRQIGEQLGITARTAGTHLANIYAKVGVRDRARLGDLVREQLLRCAAS